MNSLTYSRDATIAILGGALLALGAAGCSGDDLGDIAGGSPPNAREYEFVSANPNAPSRSADVGYGDDAMPDVAMADVSSGADAGSTPGTPESPAQVERGDIFRPMGGGLLANLNAYRGLQILDLSDPDHPRVAGQLAIDGSPAELLVVGDHAYVVSNVAAHGASQWDTRPARPAGTLVTAVDLTAPDAPRALGDALVTGGFMTSRVVSGGGREALYVVTSSGDAPAPPSNPGGATGVDLGWDTGDWGGGSGYSAAVHSFVLGNAGLDTVSSLELGGRVQAVQATPDTLMVAKSSNEWAGASAVQLFDISAPSGVVVPRGTVEVAGRVPNLFAMDLQGDILRVVSTDWRTNTVETFDASDPDRLELLDGVTFGDDEDLYATLFLGNKAFFVTFRRTDPFHAFEITDDGTIYEHNEFIISGWNDWFVPAFGGDRLVGVGTDSVDWRTVLSLSLYDTTDLDNPEPLVTRVHVGEGDSWSEANFDDRALTIIEDAVRVEAEDGSLETGLILLPFERYGSELDVSGRGVQIATFSRGSVTLRGVMGEPAGAVRRSFLVATETVANLSDAVLRLFDSASVDEPAERGHVELAPDVVDLLDFGAVLARLTRIVEASGDRGSPATARTRVDVVSAGAAESLSTLDAGAATWAARVGRRLVLAGPPDPEGTTLLTVIDLSDPDAPEEVGVVSVPFPYLSEPYPACPGCGSAQAGAPIVLEHALAATLNEVRWEPVGTVETCSLTPDWERTPECDERGCYEYSGWIECTSIDGGDPECYGAIERCRAPEPWHGFWDCQVVDPDTAPTLQECWESVREEPRSTSTLVTVDLREGRTPSAHVTLLDDELPIEAALPADLGLVYAVSQPVSVAGDPRAYSAWLARWVDLTDPTAPVIGDAINIPGRPVALSHDRLATVALAWTESGGVEATLAVAGVADGGVVLLGERTIGRAAIRRAVIDESGRLLVSYGESDCWDGPACYGPRLLVLDVESPDLAVIAELPAAYDAELIGLVGDRAVYRLAQGLAIVDYLGDPDSPVERFTPLPYAWGERLRLTDDAVLFAGRRYGARVIPIE